ncbi:LOW QUALITY PROTEIN: hypothetical protein HID58_012290 [Brassica napus]|uniref:Uncharacterized protein n=1 Tax=Brassica napus TaxID=3708 RepID=A0ABQ8E0N6_BRANA|nr:LOW QUALITY PROTEIN: hypothetical protein HID58_012290 [Brassica napus]
MILKEINNPLATSSLPFCRESVAIRRRSPRRLFRPPCQRRRILICEPWERIRRRRRRRSQSFPKRRRMLSRRSRRRIRKRGAILLELHAIVGYKGKLELHTQPIKNTRGHPEVTHLPKVTSSSSSLSEKVKSLRPIFVESRNQEANSAVDCSSIHRK